MKNSSNIYPIEEYFDNETCINGVLSIFLRGQDEDEEGYYDEYE